MNSDLKLSAYCFAFGLLIFVACDKEEPPPANEPTPEGTVINIPAAGQSGTLSLVSGEKITVVYNAAGRSLQSAPKVFIVAAYNDWANSNTVLMNHGAQVGQWTITYMIPQASYNINIAFNDGQSNATWDSQNGANWNYNVTPGPAPEVGDPPALAANASIAHVMMQGFYWDCPAGWYTTMTAKAEELRNMRGGQGIDRIWFPPPSKGFSGSFSMGYDPYDYYDVGQFSQRSTTATHFGTQEQLKAATAAYRAQGIVCLADAVLNHRSGGDGEINNNTGNTDSWTNYTGVASGKCTWRYNQFHPSSFETMDEGSFGDMADVCYETGNSPGTPRYDLIEWGKWLMDTNNAGFDGGWRFDYIKGYHPSIVADFRKGTNNAFGIIECWDGMKTIESFVKYSGNTSAFDFPTYYTMVDVFDKGLNIGGLVSPEKSFAAKTPAKAVTFVANHDTDDIHKNRMLAYAFILTYQGYPCIFWRDYFDRGLADLGGQPGNGIKALVWARGALAGGTFQVANLKSDSQTLLSYGTTSGKAGTPGYVVFINNSSSPQSAIVTTANSFLQGKTLEAHAWYSYVEGANVKPVNAACEASGRISVEVAPLGYAVYSVPVP